VNERTSSEQPPAPADSARLLASAAEAAISDLEQRLPAGMSPLEQALAARTRQAIARLLECAAQLASDELMIRGSTGQRRPHPLLKTEQELRREIDDSLGKLTFRVEQRAMLQRLTSMHRARQWPSAAEEHS
jgi:hypothetical protein